jgi:Cd2+/Zn2+-exporting ATPase
VLGLTVIGRSNMWIAVFADVGVAMIAIFNAGRTLTS